MNIVAEDQEEMWFFLCLCSLDKLYICLLQCETTHLIFSDISLIMQIRYSVCNDVTVLQYIFNY